MIEGTENINSGGIESGGESAETIPEGIAESPESILAQENLGLEREIGSNERLADAYAQHIASGTEELINEGGEEIDPELVSFAEEIGQVNEGVRVYPGFQKDSRGRIFPERFKTMEESIAYTNAHPEEQVKWDVICGRCHKKGHSAAECPENR